MRSRRSHRCSQARPGGYTLLEMLLVVTLLLVILGVVYPAFRQLFGAHKLKEQTEQVRAKFAGTRVRAIDSNVMYQFLYEPGGRRYLVIPFEHDAVDPASTGQALTPQAAAARYVFSGQLPDGFEFRPIDLSEPLGGTLPQEILATIPGSLELTNVRWSLPILFYPDGTAADYEFEVYDDKSPRHYMTLTLRGLTGTVSVSDVRQEERRYR